PQAHAAPEPHAAPQPNAAPQPHAAPQKSTAQNGLGEDREAEGRTALRNLAGITRVAEINRDGLNQIGYIAFERLIYSDAAVSILSNIFATFSESDRMVIDLRECGGGDADIVKFISNYFFDEPTHLVSTQTRNGPVQERWTKTNALSDVFSKKKLDILISESTFSAAESFSFGMQRTGRARLLGKATGGGGHMNDFFALPNGFGASISVGRTFDPRTGEGWQTRGVEPEIIFERDHTLSETMKLITAESHKLETFSPDQLDVYQTLQDYTHAWYNSESAEMAGLISAEYLATYHAGQTVETRNFDQQISSTQNGVGQRIQLYHNRIIRNIDLSGELAEADLILRDTIHRIRLQKSGEEWKILADEYKDKPMHG
ncbi:S41 family peptidase, partial [bacterium]|nr:S41 family peptidase [bacterium]